MAITVGFSCGLIGRFHSPVSPSLLPVNTRAPLKCTLHSFMLNSILHPASANFLVDISDKCESPGTMCASVNASGSHEISRLHVCVYWMLLPLGSVILSGDSVGLLLTTGAPCNRKCPVAPESDMDYCTAPCTLVRCNLGAVFGRCCRLCAAPLLSTVIMVASYIYLVENLLLIHTVTSSLSSSASMEK